MTYETTLAVAAIIQRHEPLQLDVLSCRAEVTWPDGSSVHLHAVRQHGATARYLRALHHDGTWWVIDLRLIASSLSGDLATAPERDQPGTVLYTLRATVHHARAFLAAACAQPLARWPGSPRAALPRPRRVPTLYCSTGAVDPFSDAGNRRFFAVDAGASA